MTQHSSLKVASIGARHRNVLKRYERITKLKDAEKMSDRNSAYKLPKDKLLKIKVKKAKGKEETAEGAAGTTAAPAGETKAAAKPAQEKQKAK